ncbi:Uncharacterised protein [Mycobacteroides abscessus subsp. abscessus]|nr:Uncharacterised protein [Mycobacteroides abscessus subsp. abscessus]
MLIVGIVPEIDYIVADSVIFFCLLQDAMAENTAEHLGKQSKYIDLHHDSKPSIGSMMMTFSFTSTFLTTSSI